MQLITTLKSKIHRATVTDANVDYVDSITIDEDLPRLCSVTDERRMGRLLEHLLNPKEFNRDAMR